MPKLNIELLTKLKSWLERGAPHRSIAFDMRSGTTVIYHARALDPNLDTNKRKPDCGTACCIAGAAYLMTKARKDRVFPDLQDQRRYRTGWPEIRRDALAALGLPSDGRTYMGHPLFDFNKAPKNCTPQQAAQAIQNIIDGKDQQCWEGVE